MSATTEHLWAISTQNGHSRCLMCGQENPLSLGLQFRPINDDVVQAEFRPHPILQGYDGIVHGGIVAALLDAAMTHCLFHRGIRALTGDLHVRYRKSIPIDTMLNLQARIVLIKQPLYRLRAEISQNGCIFAWAEAKFMRRP